MYVTLTYSLRYLLLFRAVVFLVQLTLNIVSQRCGLGSNFKTSVRFSWGQGGLTRLPSV